MTASAWLPLLMDPLHDSGIRHVVVYLGLYLVALAGGGIKACASALGADQFDGANPVERVAKASFFNWYYLSINIGSLLSGTVLVWVQDNVGWGIGFWIPTVLVVFGLAAFVTGRRVYRYKKLQGSPLKRVSQVVVAAVRNYNLGLPEDCSTLHEVPSPTKPNCRIQHTSQFRYFSYIQVRLIAIRIWHLQLFTCCGLRLVVHNFLIESHFVHLQTVHPRLNLMCKLISFLGMCL